MKKILSLIILVVMISGVIVSADETVDVYVNGKLLEVEQPAILTNGRTLVPLRAICEALGCEVRWYGNEKTIQIHNDVTIIGLQIDNYLMSKVDRGNESNVLEIELDVPPIINNGTTMVPARAISEALFADVKWNGSRKCVEITMEHYDNVGLFREGLAEVSKNGKWGYINTKGEVVVPLIYDRAWSFHEGFAEVKKGGKYGYVNTKGEVVVPLIYDEVDDFSEGLAIVEKDEKYGFVNTKGDVVVPVIYDDVDHYFYEGFAWVNRDGKYGFINTKGEVVIPLIYDNVGFFHLFQLF